MFLNSSCVNQHPLPQQTMVAVKTAKDEGGDTKPHGPGEDAQWILGSVARFISSLGEALFEIYGQIAGT